MIRRIFDTSAACSASAARLGAILIVVLAACRAYSQTTEQYREQDRYRYFPRLPRGDENPPPLPRESPKVKGSDKVLVAELKGLVFVDSPNKVKTGKLDVSGIHVDSGGNLTLAQSGGFREVVGRYLGQLVTMRRLNEMVRDIILFYRDNDQPVVDVSIPVQDITDGTVQVVITEARVGDVKVEGPCFFNPCVLADQICISPGMPIFESALLEDQRWLMRNPFRSIELELSPGKNRGETDVIFKVRDQPPIRAYAGYEDTGNRVTGLERTIYGINWYNAAWRDHQFGYQYSASADFNTVGVHSAVYSYARPNRDIVTFFGNFGDVDVPTGGGAFNNKGQFWQTSLRYYRELDPRNLFEHGLQAGFDFKNTNTSLDFGGVAVFASSADIIQGMLGYQAHRFDGRGSTHLALDGYFSPGHLSGRNDNFTYQTINAGADANYVYSRGYLERRTWLPQCWELVGRATGQVASTNLLPPETFGLGGYNSVRGYDQYTFAADTGYFFNLELWTPTFYVFRAADELRLLMFYDIGTGWAHSGIAGLPNNADFQSVGAGFRYQLAPNFQVRADYGFKLQSEVGVPQPDSRFHIGAVVSY